MNTDIRGFQGENRFLSNFYPSPMKIDGLTFATGEHYYQALKCTSGAEAINIAKLPTPGEAKRAGRIIQVRSDWNMVKHRAMEMVSYSKYFQNPDLMEKLLDTDGQLLVESNTWHDNFWGECSCEKCLNVPKINALGKILMRVRELVIQKTEIDF